MISARVLPAALVAGSAVFVAVNVGGPSTTNHASTVLLENNGVSAVAHEATLAPPPSLEDLSEVVQRTCGMCHNDRLRTAELSLEGFSMEKVTEGENLEIAEKMITKLRLGMMPPPNIPKPGGDTMQILVETIENIIDEDYASRPRLVNRPLQRMPRAEYERTIRSLLDLQIDASAYLPAEALSDAFDNIADIQVVSGTLIDSYLRAAGEISRLAVGEPNPAVRQAAYAVDKMVNQMVHVEGTPYGTRGGISVVHNFPADAEYLFRGYF